MDRLASMAAFVKAVELGSFSSAAEALRMSPQLVGQHVRALEQNLGVRLLNRTTRRQSLTEIGGTFYERARNILAEVEAAEALAAETRAVPRGRLRINAPISFGAHALTPRLPEYLRQFPEVTIDLSLTNRYVDLVEEGYDVAFRVGELADSSLIARPLAPYRLALCAAPSYLASRGPLRSPGDLQRCECLGFAYGLQKTNWIFDGPEGRAIITIAPRFVTDSGEALRAAAVAGLGVVLQPRELVEEDLASGRLVELLPGYRSAASAFHLVYAADRRMTPKLRSFLDFAVARFGPAAS